MDHLLIDERELNACLLEENARVWDLRAVGVINPRTRKLLKRRAVRGRKLAERLRDEAASAKVAVQQAPASAPLGAGQDEGTKASKDLRAIAGTAPVSDDCIGIS